MPAAPQREQASDKTRHERQKRHARVGGRVLDALGEPDGRHEVQVRELWEGHYRVNVLVGADAVSLRVAHSYFLVTDGDGNILAAAPEITKRY